MGQGVHCNNPKASVHIHLSEKKSLAVNIAAQPTFMAKNTQMINSCGKPSHKVMSFKVQHRKQKL